jgi:imidazolonepropionase-like amidohydrolase
MTEDGIEVDHDLLESAIRNGIVLSMTSGMRPGQSVPPRIAAMLPQLAAIRATAWAAGAAVVASSDCGIGPAKPHDILPQAVVDLVESGAATPVQALHAITAAAADECRIGDRHGRVRPGYSADFLAVNGDVFSSITAIHDVAAVVRAGERVR